MQFGCNRLYFPAISRISSMSKRGASGVVFVLVCWTALAARAAEPPTTPKAPPTAGAAASAAASFPAPSPGLTADKILARRFMLTARLVMMGPPADYRLAASRLLIDRACALDPSNGEYWRLAMESAELAQDKAALRTALSNYLKIDPADDAAQWRLIQLLIDDQQTAKDRITTYERLLPSNQLSRGLRSRIAHAAAVLKRDSGDLTGYAQLLKQAITLDEANPQAAAEAYALLTERNAPPADVAQALFNLAMANPTDPSVTGQVAATMLRAGQYRRAVEWFEATGGLWTYRGAPDPSSAVLMSADWALALWGAERTGEAAKMLEGFAAAVRGTDPKALLPVAISSLTVAVQSAQKNEAAAASAFGELEAVLSGIIQNAPEDAGPLVDLIWAHVLFNRKLEAVGALMSRLEKLPGVDATVLARLRGWWLIRQGKKDEAAKQLVPIAVNDGLADFGLCLLESGDTAQRIAHLNRVFAAAPGTMIGVMADRMIRELGGRGQPGGEALAIARLEQQLPDKVRRAASSPLQFVILKLRSVRTDLRYGEPIDMDVELTNVSGMPLSMGPDGVINGSCVLSTGLTLRGKVAPNRANSVVRLDRRLRLEPGASVTVRAPVDIEPVASILNDLPTESLLLRISGVLHAVPRQGGGFTPGLLGSTQTEKPVERVAWAATPQNVQAALQTVKAGEGASRVVAAAVLARVVPTLAGSYAQQGDRLSDDLIRTVKSWPMTEQATVLSFVADHARPRTLFSPLIEAAVRSDDVTYFDTAIMTMVKLPDSPILLAALRKDAGPVKDLAQNWLKIVEAAAELRKKGAQEQNVGGTDNPPVEKKN
jgi:tetratricopeptide (TPR) repeat protein